MLPSPLIERPKLIQLPRSSSRLQKQSAHLKLLTAVHPSDFSTAFEGRIMRPGALISADKLPNPAVVLECAGFIGTGSGHNRRDMLWILWLYDWSADKWIELARAAAKDWGWTLALREPAIRALHPRPEFCDVLERGRSLAGEIMVLINGRLEPEIDGVRVNVLASVYDQVAGCMALLA